jgi:hypothetical protein
MLYISSFFFRLRAGRQIRPPEMALLVVGAKKQSDFFLCVFDINFWKVIISLFLVLREIITWDIMPITHSLVEVPRMRNKSYTLILI